MPAHHVDGVHGQARPRGQHGRHAPDAPGARLLAVRPHPELHLPGLLRLLREPHEERPVDAADRGGRAGQGRGPGGAARGHEPPPPGPADVDGALLPRQRRHDVGDGGRGVQQEDAHLRRLPDQRRNNIRGLLAVLLAAPLGDADDVGLDGPSALPADRGIGCGVGVNELGVGSHCSCYASPHCGAILIGEGGCGGGLRVRYGYSNCMRIMTYCWAIRS